MSYGPRGPGRPSPLSPLAAQDDYYARGKSQPGSVRAARERLVDAQARLQATSPGAKSADGLQQHYSSLRSPDRSQVPAHLYEPHYPAQPSPQSPQWPLSRDYGPPAALNVPRSVPLPPRNPARQAQNQYGPSSNSAYAYPPQPAMQQMHKYPPPPIPENSGLSSTVPGSRPITTSSQNTDDSLGSIPDFPVPAPTGNSQHYLQGNAFAGRRGPSSYYSQYSNAAPLKQEGSRGSVKSYASSNVISSAMTDFYLDASPSEDDDGRTRSTDHIGKSSPLVRQASFGKRGKPMLTSIKNRSKPPSPPDVPERAAFPSNLTLTPSEESLVRKGGPAVLNALLASKRLGSSRTQTPVFNSQPDLKHNEENSYADELDEYLGELDKVSNEQPPNLKPAAKSKLADRVGMRKPEDLDVEKVRQEEARGSLTSLPELIRRATKLAANLDRGKTASRLGMEWMIKEENSGLRPIEANRGLTRLPSPARSTPGSEWPSSRSQRPILHGSDGSKTPPSKRERRCCGMSRNAFIGLMFLLILLISAAVIIPVALIVIPKSNNSVTSTGTCNRGITCTNGGTSTTLSNGSCGCICVNGFQGRDCSTATDEGCTTVAITGVKKATTGTEVAGLLQQAQTFNIPLDSRALITQFAQENLTCATENALIRLVDSSPAIRPQKRQAPVTTNGIVIAGPTATAAPPAITISPITPGGAPGTAPTANLPILNTTAQAFAKIGILFVLQDSQTLNTAVTAQENIRGFMSEVTAKGATPASSTKIPLGSGYFINMWDWQITVKNGTSYGQRVTAAAT